MISPNGFDISEWFTANKLTINPSKSNALVIPPNLSQPLPSVDLSINNSLLPFCLSAKYLGVTLDTQLNFDKHISSVENKISRTVGIISKLRHYLPTCAILQQTVLFSNTYASAIWTGSVGFFL